MQGTITRYFADRAFGLIKPDGSRSDVFFHKSAMTGGTVPAVDVVVEFVEEMGSNGRLRAHIFAPWRFQPAIPDYVPERYFESAGRPQRASWSARCVASLDSK